MKESTQPQGAIAILSVIAISVFVLAIITTASAITLGELKMASGNVATDKTFYAAEAGLNDALYRLISDPLPSASTLTLDSVTTTTTVAPDPTNGYRRIITSTAVDRTGKRRVVQITATSSSFAGSFDFAVQSGIGGLSMLNNSKVVGNVYSNGNIIGGNGAAVQATVEGNVTIANAGSMRGVEIDGDAYANTIAKSEISGDAHYQSIDGSTTVGGTKYPGSANPPAKPFPISNADIVSWKNDAAAGGVLSGNLTINGTQTLGPKKIEGNLELSQNAHLIITGTVWVTGNITLTKPNLQISLDPSFAKNSGLLISDGKIDIKNNANISGSGNPKSFLLVLSTNSSIDPSSPAINAINNCNTVIFYAENGMVTQNNNCNLNATLGYIVRLENNVTVTYNPALQAFSVPPPNPQPVGSVLGTWKEL